MHLLIPFAASQSPDCRQAIGALALPNLERLLGKCIAADIDTGAVDSLSPPHERAMAWALGIAPNGTPLADGCLPWGAWYAAQASLPHTESPGVDPGWCIITPALWTVQTNHITMGDPRALKLAEADSRALLATLAPYFSDDGIALHFDKPTRWLACGDVFRGLATASVDRVVGRNVDDWLPKGPAAKSLRRLQQEMQMLLYTHPLTDTRAAQGLPAVNSFWVSGTGSLPADGVKDGAADAATQVVCATTLRDPALHEDWAAWTQAWQQIDAVQCAAALAQIQRGGPFTLTLCGESNARRFTSGNRGVVKGTLAGLAAKVRSFSGHKPSRNILSML